jgi:hypothetical protein
MSQALSNEISNRISADNAVSANALSMNNTLSQGISVISQQVSVLSAGLVPFQVRTISAADVGISATALTPVTGLSASVTGSGAIYQVNGILLLQMSVANTIGIGLTFPGMKQAGGFIRGMQVITQGGDSYSTTRGMQAVFNETGSASIIFSVTIATGTNTTFPIKIDGLFVTSTAGTIQVAARASATTSPLTFKVGSYLQALKIG